MRRIEESHRRATLPGNGIELGFADVGEVGFLHLLGGGPVVR
jgi:hypothetical protein